MPNQRSRATPRQARPSSPIARMLERPMRTAAACRHGCLGSPRPGTGPAGIAPVSVPVRTAVPGPGRRSEAGSGRYHAPRPRCVAPPVAWTPGGVAADRSTAHRNRLARCAAAVLCVAALLGAPASLAAGATAPVAQSGQGIGSPGAAEPAGAIPPGQVVAVPPWLDELVRTRVVRPAQSKDARLRALVALLFDPSGLALQYEGSRTRTVGQSAADRQANCVTFALLFVELARRAGLEAYVQETDQVLAWQGDDALYGTGHINVGVKTGRSRMTVDIDSSVVSIHGQPRRISDERALSHFYNNRGAELMEEGALDAARAHFAQAIALTPDFVPALNNLGVLDMRSGDFAAAERAYAAALDRDPRHAPTLSNLVNFYRRTGDARLQHQFEERLFRLQRRDPFHQVILALGYEREGEYAEAADHYERALRLKARQHFVYFGLARAYAHLGQTRKAIDALVKARDLAGDKRDMYQTKLEKLRRLHPLANF